MAPKKDECVQRTVGVNEVPSVGTAGDAKNCEDKQNQNMCHFFQLANIYGIQHQLSYLF
jgi:hypothetical protein